jgi:hypothetical protein
MGGVCVAASDTLIAWGTRTGPACPILGTNAILRVATMGSVLAGMQGGSRRGGSRR